MKRYVMTKIQKWKDSPDREPLVIRRARQVGKAWIMKEFGKISTIISVIVTSMRIIKLILILLK